MSDRLARWNFLPVAAAVNEILPCCGSRAWAEGVAKLRPLTGEADLLAAADDIWRRLPESGWLEAFRSHPRIGESRIGESRSSTAGWAQSAAWSEQEQRNVADTGEAVKVALAEGNRAYERRFNRIFIVCATGKSAAEILEILQHRLENDDHTELQEAAEQQRQIMEIRLRKWLQGQEYRTTTTMMRISTHVLDIAQGEPAKDVPVRLERRDASGMWRLLAAARTDQDGRCAQLLPEREALTPGFYRLGFETATYFAARNLDGLYPLVEITFQVRDSQHHFHIPLLLSPNGYTTYRGN